MSKTNKPCRASLAIEYKCHSCMADYFDGHVDCEITTCALYAWQPYRKLEPNTAFLAWSPRGTGKRPTKGSKPATDPKIDPVPDKG